MIPVAIDAPTGDDRRYWHVSFQGQVVALCPSEQTALLVAEALWAKIDDKAKLKGSG